MRRDEYFGGELDSRPRWITGAEAATMLGLTIAGLFIFVQQKKIPPPYWRKVCEGGKWMWRQRWRRASIELMAGQFRIGAGT